MDTKLPSVSRCVSMSFSCTSKKSKFLVKFLNVMMLDDVALKGRARTSTRRIQALLSTG